MQADPDVRWPVEDQTKTILNEAITSDVVREKNIFEDYRKGIELLGYLTYMYSEEGMFLESKDLQIENLINSMKTFGTSELQEINNLFVNYQAEYSCDLYDARYTIAPQDSTFQTFLNTSVALVALIELARSAEVSLENIDPTLNNLGKLWIEMSDKICTLDTRVRENGVNLDFHEAMEEQRVQRQADEEAYEAMVAAENQVYEAMVEAEHQAYEALRDTEYEERERQYLESRPENEWDREYDRDPYEEEEVHQVEDVANWVGPDGTWT